MFDEEEYFSLLHSLEKTLPKRPDGRIDYTTAKKAAVLTIFIQYKNEILLLKRSNEVLTYKGKWNTVAGYLDQIKPIKEKIYEELIEEIGLTEEQIRSYHVGTPYSFDDKTLHTTWIVYPVLVKLDHKPEISLDWEHTDYSWIQPDKIESYDLVPNTHKSLKKALEILNQ